MVPDIVLDISGSEGRGLDPYLSALSISQFIAVLVKDTYRDTGKRISHADHSLAVVLVKYSGLIIDSGDRERLCKTIP